MGCYIAPSNASTIEYVAAAIRGRPYRAEFLVAVHLNVNLAEQEGTLQGEAITDELAAAGLMDMGLHFLPWRKTWFQDRCTWSMQRDGREVQYRTDYILGTDCRFFQDVAVWDTLHHSDHYMVLGCLRGEPVKELTGYLCKARRSPLQPLRRKLVSAPEKLFSELKTHIPKPLLRERARRAWIYDKTWAAIDARVTARQEGAHRTVWKLSRKIHAGLKTDRKRWAGEVGRTIESLLASDPPPLREAWVRMRGQCRDAADTPPPPSVYILGDPDGKTCGALRPRPVDGETYSQRNAPLHSG